MDKVDTTGWTPGGYIDALMATGHVLRVTGANPAKRAWLAEWMPEDPAAHSKAARETEAKWRAMFDDGHPDTQHAVMVELWRRGMWDPYDLWPEGSRLDGDRPLRGIDISGVVPIAPHVPNRRLHVHAQD